MKFCLEMFLLVGVPYLLTAVMANGRSNEAQLRGGAATRSSSSTAASRTLNAAAESSTTTVQYPSDLPYSEPILNPERGFYWQDSYYASSPERLDPVSLASERVSTGMTLVLRLYYLDTFLYTDSIISQSVLDDIAADFEAMRMAGVKSVLRFAYVNDDSSDFTEPEKDTILSHIEQLAPILTAGQDVIVAMQAGFVGPWGEWHLSTHFGNPDDWEGLGQVLAALLEAVPDRVVQIRTPMQKRTIYASAVLPEPTTDHVVNGGFEGTEEVVGSNWKAYSNGFLVTTEEAHTGTQSIAVTNGAAKQWVPLPNAGPGSTIEISGYTKSVSTSTAMDGDYSIYADVELSDGSYLWGQVAKFTGGTTADWEYAEYTFEAPQGVKGLTLYSMYRGDSSGGTAYFDDLQVRVFGPPMYTEGGALDSTSAFDGSHLARTGHHNDCFLGSGTDMGTYINPDQTEYEYLSQDTKYTAMGGETCKLNSPRSDCPTASSELGLFHYSYLNSGYRAEVLHSWTEDKCMDEITAKLGYRLVLRAGTFSTAAVPGGNVPYHILIENVGYAAPINPRRIQIVLREASTGAICAATDTTTDARMWYGGGELHTVEGTAVLPENMPPGTYELLLNIADPNEKLKTMLDFKTKVANAGGLNEPDSGLINLQHSIQVGEGLLSSSSAAPPMLAVVCGVENDVLPPSVGSVNPASYVLNGSFEGTPSLDWNGYIDGYQVTTTESHSGRQSVKVSNGGAKQIVLLDAPVGSTITLSGYSKAIDISSDLGSDYSIYADVKHTDGSSLWGQAARFSGVLSTEWEYSEYSFVATKHVEKLYLYALYRNDPAVGGTVYFDDIEILVDLPLVTNGGFEGASVSEDWDLYSNGYILTTAEAHSGSGSVMVRDGAARQFVTLHAESGSTIILSGYSKAVGTSIGLWDYSIYADIAFDDGSYLWGQMAKFTGGTTADWEYAEKTIVVPLGKTVISMFVYALYRNDPQHGIAYFDDVRVGILES